MIKLCVNCALEFVLAKLQRFLLRVCYGWPPVVEALHTQQSGLLSTVQRSVSFKRHFRRGSRHVDCVCEKSHDLRLLEFHLNSVQSGCKRASRCGLHMFVVRMNSNLSNQMKESGIQFEIKGKSGGKRVINACERMFYTVYVIILNKG